jgi:2-hydroxy-3-keto-5-methylthiopentenyl-1-phosphate phosphatase
VANVLCFDFDDTIVLENMARAVFERFAGPGWRDDEASYYRGELTVEQFNVAALDRVDPATEPDEIRDFAATTATVRPGFAELVGWAEWQGWQVVVVSNGFDVYIDPVLDVLRLDRVVRHRARAERGYRWRARYLSPRGIELHEGFKLSYAHAFQNAGDFVAYVGDGASDVEAARLANAVFARSTLWERLNGVHPRIYPFDTFDDVRSVMEREADQWLRSFSSTTAAGA